MSDVTNQPFNYENAKHLSDFLLASAGIVRDVLSVVNRHAPDLIPEQVRSSWFGGANPLPSNAKIGRLLAHAEENVERFHKRFVGYFDSIPGGITEVDGSLGGYIERLQSLMAEFVTRDDLATARGALRGGRRPSWDSLVNFSGLPEIRTLIDQIRQDHLKTLPPVAADRFHFVEPDSIRQGGGRLFPARPKVYRLLRYLSEHQSQCTVKTLEIGAVWAVNDKPEGDNPHGRIDSLLTATRRFLQRFPVRYTVTRKNGLVFLKRVEESQRTSLESVKKASPTVKKAVNKRSTRSSKRAMPKPGVKKKRAQPRKRG